MTTATASEIVTVPVSSSIEEYVKTAASLVELDRRYKGVRYDVNTKDGLLAATKARAELRTLRVALEKTRVAIKAPALQRTKEIDTEARRLTTAISELEDPIDAQIKAEETRKENERLAVERAEQERVTAEQEAIRQAEQRKMAEQQAEIKRRQDELDRAEHARKEAELENARAIEAQARAARLRIEEEERKARALRDEQDRLARLAREEEERLAREAMEAKELELKKERDRLDAERRVVEEAQRKAREEEELKAKQERDRLDAERRVVEEAQRKAREEEELKAKQERDRKEAEQRAADEKKRKAKEKEDEKQREIQRKANEMLDAHAMLTSFIQRFGHLDEFAPVVTVITKFLTLLNK